MADEEIGVRVRLKERRRFAAETKAAARNIGDIADAADRADARIRAVNQRFALMRNAMSIILPVGLVTGLGLVTAGIAGLTVAVVALTSALAPLSGAMVFMPGAAAMMVQAMGTIKVATAGLGDQLEEFSAAFERPTLAGARFNRFLMQFVPSLRQVQATTQRRFLSGVTEGIDAASSNFNVFRHILYDTATTLGQLAARFGTMMGSSAWGRDLALIGNTARVSMLRFGGAAFSLLNALRHLLVAARPLSNWFTRLIVTWAKGISSAALLGRRTGTLANFFARTRMVMTQVFSIAGALWQSLRNIGRAAFPLGYKILRTLNEELEDFARWSGSVAGQARLRKYFKDMEPVVWELGRLTRDLVKAIFAIGNQPGVARLIMQIRTQLLPAFVQLVNQTTQAFGPVLIGALTNLTELLATLWGSAGPLTLYVQGLSLMLEALNALLVTVPGADSAFVGLAATLVSLRIISSVIKGILALRAAIIAISATTKSYIAVLGIYRAVFIANTGITNASTLAVLRHVAATKVATTATKAWAAAQTVLNFVQSKAKLPLIITLVLAVAAAFVVAYKKVGWFRRIVQAVWSWIRDNWQKLAILISGPIGLAVVLVVRHFNRIKTAAVNVWNAVRGAFNSMVRFIGGMGSRISSAASGMFNGIRDAFRNVFDWIVDKINWIVDRIRWLKDQVDNVLPGGSGGRLGPGGGGGLIPGLPDALDLIPGAATGGLLRSGSAFVGEEGMELLTITSRGTRIDPLPQVSPRARGRSSSSGVVPLALGDFDAVERVTVIDVYIDGKKVAESTHRHASDAEARR